MTLRLPAPRPLLPIPLSLVLTLVWVGVVRLFYLWLAIQARRAYEGEAWIGVLFEERVLGRARLPTMIVAVSLLLLIYLWLDYRSRPARGWQNLAFLLAAALLVYLGWAAWYAWWDFLDVPSRPADVLMTDLRLAAPAAG